MGYILMVILTVIAVIIISTVSLALAIIAWMVIASRRQSSIITDSRGNLFVASRLSQQEKER